MTNVQGIRWTSVAMVLPGMFWLFAFAVVPVGLLFVLSLWTAGMFGIERTWTLRNYVTIFSDPVYLLILLKTLRIAIISTVLSLLLSYPLAMFLSRLSGRTRTAFLLLMFLPFWSSYVVRSYMWLPVLGRGGIVNQALMSVGIIDQPIDGLLFNEGAVYVGLIYVYTLFMVLPILLSLDRIDRSLFEAGTDLGARPFDIFLRITLPMTMPGVWSGCTMVFLLSVGAYVAPQLLGGTSGVMIGNIIASQFLSTNNWPLGAALASVLLLLVGLIFVFFGRQLGLRQLFMGDR